MYDWNDDTEISSSKNTVAWGPSLGRPMYIAFPLRGRRKLFYSGGGGRRRGGGG